MTDLPDDAPLPPGMFLAPMPWWVLRDDAAAGYVVLDAADGATCLAAFTDEDLADRFAAATGFDGRAVPAATPADFLDLLRAVPPICTYVAFDPPGHVGGRARWVVPVPRVRAVLTAIRAATEEGDDPDPIDT
jgi:hypothetical protein